MPSSRRSADVARRRLDGTAGEFEEADGVVDGVDGAFRRRGSETSETRPA